MIAGEQTRTDVALEQIAADETSARRGHDYISLFVDMARRKVVYVTEGKDAATVDAFAAFLEAHGGNRANITDASIDMGAAFIAGVKANFPNAKIAFERCWKRPPRAPISAAFQPRSTSDVATMRSLSPPSPQPSCTV